jgi:hypothetical protein
MGAGEDFLPRPSNELFSERHLVAVELDHGILDFDLRHKGKLRLMRPNFSRCRGAACPVAGRGCYSTGLARGKDGIGRNRRLVNA